MIAPGIFQIGLQHFANPLFKARLMEHWRLPVFSVAFFSTIQRRPITWRLLLFQDKVLAAGMYRESTTSSAP